MPEWAGEFKDTDVSNWLAKQSHRWPDQESMARSHMNLESLKGVPETQLIKLADTDDREAWHGPGGIYSRLGRPDSADQYVLPEVGEGKDVFDITKPFREACFEEGVNGGAVERIGAKIFGEMFTFQENYNTELQRNMVEGHETLKREWGADYDANFSIAKKGAEALGFDVNSDEGLNTLMVIEREIGTRAFLHHMHQIGQRLGSHDAGEHGESQTSATFMSPEQAVSEIDRLNADPDFTKLYLSSGSEGDEARERMNQLFKWSSPG